MNEEPSNLDLGRAACDRSSWSSAYRHLSAADTEAELEAQDLERLATAAYMVGEYAESTESWARAHRKLSSAGDVARAARCAFWLAFGLMNRGERARASGWTARARRLLDDHGLDCAERGYLQIPTGLECVLEGDIEGAYAAFCQAADIADRFDEPDLTALARHSTGRVLIRMGQLQKGVSLLDEAMAAVDAGEVSAVVVGDVYCSVIEGCMEIFDLRRAQEWTVAMSAWCDSQSDMVAYTGQCLVRRSQLLEMRGEWKEALASAKRACESLVRGAGQPAAGAAFYQQAELHRLRGEIADAEKTYRQASRWGRKPQPGLALLRLDQGQTDAAEAAIRRALSEAKDRSTRCTLLPGHTEILLAAGDVTGARAGAEELAEIANALDQPHLHAVAASAVGAVLLAEDNPRSALQTLRKALNIWMEIKAPYEAARVRVLIGLACQKLGDNDTAEVTLQAARSVFAQLGAVPALEQMASRSQQPAVDAMHGLTNRELEVLQLVAAGGTNKSIAKQLFISEKTVARHVSSILSKLDVPNRSSAAAYAYRNSLV